MVNEFFVTTDFKDKYLKLNVAMQSPQMLFIRYSFQLLIEFSTSKKTQLISYENAFHFSCDNLTFSIHFTLTFNENNQKKSSSKEKNRTKQTNT